MLLYALTSQQVLTPKGMSENGEENRNARNYWDILAKRQDIGMVTMLLGLSTMMDMLK